MLDRVVQSHCEETLASCIYKYGTSKIKYLETLYISSDYSYSYDTINIFTGVSVIMKTFSQTKMSASIN